MRIGNRVVLDHMGEILGVRAYAKRRGVTPTAVSLAIKNGRLVESVERDHLGNPKIDADVADREWDANTDHRMRKRETVGERESGPHLVTEGENAATVGDARARKTHWEAELAALKFKEAAGELVPAADVERRMVDVFSAAKTRLLALPSRLKQLIPHLTIDELAAAEQVVREALEQLADGEQRAGGES